MFTCFCPACCAKMREWGVNPEQMRIEVSKFRSGERAMPPEEWLAFRAQSVREALDAFRKIVKGVRSDLMFGAFVFPHSLGALVGQTDEALESLDIIAPMLYRPVSTAARPGDAESRICRARFGNRKSANRAPDGNRAAGERDRGPAFRPKSLNPKREKRAFRIKSSRRFCNTTIPNCRRAFRLRSWSVRIPTG